MAPLYAFTPLSRRRRAIHPLALFSLIALLSTTFILISWATEKGPQLGKGVALYDPDDVKEMPGDPDTLYYHKMKPFKNGFHETYVETSGPTKRTTAKMMHNTLKGNTPSDMFMPLVDPSMMKRERHLFNKNAKKQLTDTLRELGRPKIKNMPDFVEEHEDGVVEIYDDIDEVYDDEDEYYDDDDSLTDDSESDDDETVAEIVEEEYIETDDSSDYTEVDEVEADLSASEDEEDDETDTSDETSDSDESSASEYTDTSDDDESEYTEEESEYTDEESEESDETDKTYDEDEYESTEEEEETEGTDQEEEEEEEEEKEEPHDARDVLYRYDKPKQHNHHRRRRLPRLSAPNSHPMSKPGTHREREPVTQREVDKTANDILDICLK